VTDCIIAAINQETGQTVYAYKPYRHGEYSFHKGHSTGRQIRPYSITEATRFTREDAEAVIETLDRRFGYVDANSWITNWRIEPAPETRAERDLSHLHAIELRLSHERARVDAAITDRERNWRQHNVRMIEREREAEIAFLTARGITVDDAPATMTDDELLGELFS
jgi:hypothetical protein